MTKLSSVILFLSSLYFSTARASFDENDGQVQFFPRKQFTISDALSSFGEGYVDGVYIAIGSYNTPNEGEYVSSFGSRNLSEKEKSIELIRKSQWDIHKDGYIQSFPSFVQRLIDDGQTIKSILVDPVWTPETYARSDLHRYLSFPENSKYADNIWIFPQIVESENDTENLLQQGILSLLEQDKVVFLAVYEDARASIANNVYNKILLDYPNLAQNKLIYLRWLYDHSGISLNGRKTVRSSAAMFHGKPVTADDQCTYGAAAHVFSLIAYKCRYSEYSMAHEELDIDNPTTFASEFSADYKHEASFYHLTPKAHDFKSAQECGINFQIGSLAPIQPGQFPEFHFEIRSENGPRQIVNLTPIFDLWNVFEAPQAMSALCDPLKQRLLR